MYIVSMSHMVWGGIVHRYDNLGWASIGIRIVYNLDDMYGYVMQLFMILMNCMYMGHICWKFCCLEQIQLIGVKTNL
jgi:hypothetical protein